MQICPGCTAENPPGFRLCGYCGTALAPSVPVQETRKTVTIVFSDLKGSTALGEQLDSEALREVMSRYFEAMQTVLEEHGGTVEKFIGDAVMAVFGLPRVREDDALRAVRAAAGMRRSLAALNDELEQRWGVRLVNRTGVNTGEVVAGDPSSGQRLVTGDAVNLAARLEQAAPDLDVLLGERTYRLVRDSIEATPVEPLSLKGKADPVPAYRLVSVDDRQAPRQEGPERKLVGREDEHSFLVDAFEASAAARRCRVVTVIGDAGVGKSLLLEKLGAAVAPRATVLVGRCLSYGRGITFWPVVEIVRTAAGIEPTDTPELARQRLATVAGGIGADVSERVAAAIGLLDTSFPLSELFWGIRRLLESLAGERPLVVVVEDVHWAESVLLDLVEQLSGSPGLPLLVVCAARPELLEQRPSWVEHHPDVLRLDALSQEESGTALDGLLGSGRLEEAVRTRLLAAAEGNPLYAAQLLATLIEDGILQLEGEIWRANSAVEELSVPPTIHALLATRLDLLDSGERAVVEAAAVVGVKSPVAALEALVPEPVRPSLRVHLGELERKRLLEAAGSDTVRFHHGLIRDAAYEGLLKRSRASLHERFARWAEEVNRETDRAAEHEEILAYHLEQAHRYLGELGPLREHGHELGREAAAKLSAAGARAFARGDMPAAANLLRRAASVLPDEASERTRLLPMLGEALMESGEFAWAQLYLDEAVAAAAREDDETLAADASLTRLLVRHHVSDDLVGWREEAEREAERVLVTLDGTGSHDVLAKAWRLVGFVHGSICRYALAARAVESSLGHARLAGDTRLAARNASAYGVAALNGPTAAGTAIEYCELILADGTADRQAETLVLGSLARLRAMLGDFEEARALHRRARVTVEELGGIVLAASSALTRGHIELLAGDLAAAEDELRAATVRLESVGERYLLPVVVALRAHVVLRQGRLDEAIEATRQVEALAADDDVETQALWRSALAIALARSGRLAAAEEPARVAVALLAETDAVTMQADALVALGEVLATAGNEAAASAAYGDALKLYSAKGHAVGAERTALLLDATAPV